MFDFPNTPTPGQIYLAPNGAQYIWSSGGVWMQATPTSTRTAQQNNLVINPAMRINNEGSGLGNTSGFYPVDQWVLGLGGPVCSIQQVASPTPDGSPYRLRKIVTTLKTPLAANDLVWIYQPIEGVRAESLFFGTAGARQSVVRFGWKAPAGVYSFALRNGAGNRSYVKNFTIAAGQANTDTIQTFIIPGDTTGTWPNDSSLGLSVAVADAVGSTYIGVEGWQAGNMLGTAANTNMAATNGNTVELFDFGFYPDPEKTGLPPPFIAPQYYDEYMRCLRYLSYAMAACQAPVQTNGLTPWYTRVPMRITPTLSVASAGSAANATVAQDTVYDNNGGFMQISLTAGNGYFVNRVYKLNARM